MTDQDRRELAKTDRDEANRAVLRHEQVPTLSGVALVPATLLLGLLTGGVLFVGWLDTPFARSWPRLSLVASFAVSGGLLLRSAWRIGRVRGARGP